MSQFCQIVAERLPSGRYRLKCSACAFEREFYRPKLVRKCDSAPPRQLRQPPRGPCAHLGAELRLEECPTCGGKQKVKIKVFSCPLHGECTISKRVDTLAVCSVCPNWTPTLPPPAATSAP